MRKILILTALVLFAATIAGCKYCDRLRRGSLCQPFNAPTVPYCDTCTTCAPETPCGGCDACANGVPSMPTTTTKPLIMPGPES